METNEFGWHCLMPMLTAQCSETQHGNVVKETATLCTGSVHY